MRFVSLAMALMTSAILTGGCGSSNVSPTPVTPTPTPSPTPGVPASTVTVFIPTGATALTTTAYVPNPVTVSVGTTLTWVNNDVDPHTSTSTTNVWGSPTLPPGASFSFRFQSPGAFPYLCLIHANMTGTINVQ